MELRHTYLDNHPVLEFLVKIKTIIDDLTSVGDAATYHEHMDSILEGLPKDFDSVVALIESSLPHISIEEAEGLILAPELRLQKYVTHLVEQFLCANSESHSQKLLAVDVRS